MARSDYYRMQAQECLAAARVCSEQKEAAQLAIIAASYLERAELLERVSPARKATRRDQRAD